MAAIGQRSKPVIPTPRIIREVDQEYWDNKAQEAGISWLSPVESAHTPTDARCISCGRRSKVLPSSVLDGQPACGACRSSDEMQPAELSAQPE